MKYHLGKDGTAKVCRAKKACPFGSITDHFNTVEEAQKVSDELNEQLQNSQSFGIAKSGNWIQTDKETEMTVVRLNNLRVTMARLENIKNNARKQILETMKGLDVKSIKEDGVATISFIKGKPALSVDVEALKERGLYEEYLKSTTVKEYTSLDVEKDDRQLRFEEKMTMPSGESINFNLYVDSNGVAHMNEDTRKAIKELKKFEDTLKQTQELEKELRKGLMEQMKEHNVSELKVGKAKLVYNPEHERKIVDTKKLKDDKLYNSVTREIEKSDSIRILYK